MKILKEYNYKGYGIEYPKHFGAYGVTVAKDGKVVMEFDNEHDAEEWIDEQEAESLNEELNPEDVGASSLFMDLINKEYELLQMYDSAQVTLDANGDNRFEEIFNYIADDINIHVGMLQSCLEDLNDSGAQTEEGEQKADELIGESLTEGYEDIPLIDRIDFENKSKWYPSIIPFNDFIDALNKVGKDVFKVRTTKFGKNLSNADLTDEWMNIKKNGWSIQLANDSSLPGFKEVYICRKIQPKEESLTEATKLDIIKKHREIYNKILEDIKNMSGLEKDVAENITLTWIKGINGDWLGGLGSGSSADKLFEKVVKLGYSPDEISSEFERQMKIYSSLDEALTESQIGYSDEFV